MKIYLLGLCGTFMGSLALIAKQMGHQVSGNDSNVYSPMSDILQSNQIPIDCDSDPQNAIAALKAFAPDCVIIANAICRGNPCLEYILNKKLAFSSGPAWLASQVLHKKRVLAVAGTHGKTTTTSMLAHILEVVGLAPSFLIGGVPNNFKCSARFTQSDYFVIEADEYDTAFFDKRAKFVHYLAEIAVINNLEFDHADIYTDLDAIVTQFHHMVRTMPSRGHILLGERNQTIETLIAKGSWCPHTYIDAQWRIEKSLNKFKLIQKDQTFDIPEQILGHHNVKNALSAIAVCDTIGIDTSRSVAALQSFSGVKRRLELIFNQNNITIYDDFAHHPTAIKAILNTLSAKQPKRLLAVLEFGSRTMQLGTHRDTLVSVLKLADRVYCHLSDNLNWSVSESFASLGERCVLSTKQHTLLRTIKQDLQSGDCLVILRNTGFSGFKEKLLSLLK